MQAAEDGQVQGDSHEIVKKAQDMFENKGLLSLYSCTVDTGGCYLSRARVWVQSYFVTDGSQELWACPVFLLSRLSLLACK